MCEPLTIATIGAAVLSTGTSVIMGVNQANAARDAQAAQKDQTDKALAVQKQQDAASIQDPNLQLTAQKNRDAIARLRMGTPSTIAAAAGGMGSAMPSAPSLPRAALPMGSTPQMATAMAMKQRLG